MNRSRPIVSVMLAVPAESVPTTIAQFEVTEAPRAPA